MKTAADEHGGGDARQQGWRSDADANANADAGVDTNPDEEGEAREGGDLGEDE